MIRTHALKAVAFATLALGLPAQGLAEYPEKEITFIIPFSPGGGMDTTPRAIVGPMSKYLPNNVKVVPKNVPGAGGRRGYAELMRAAPDGYTICVINFPGAAIPSLTGQKVSYDINQFVWIARMSNSAYVIAAAGKNDAIKGFADLKKLGRPVKMTHTGYGSTSYAAAGIVRDATGIESVPLSGYKSSSEYIVGMIRGDGDATIAPVESFYKFVQSGDVRALATFEAKPTLPNVPTIRSLGYEELEGLGVDRMVAAPPGTPDHIRKILSNAIVKAMQDPEAQAWAKKVRRPFQPMDTDEATAHLTKSIAFYTKYKSSLLKRD
ncbi:MAG: tripartite tricarboxylate transporter substrate binding protein [Betaproteobacteria bacterium]|nr:tripartite tricarboxylate transporter substrate binding protein [Betaproteobacteria bacterium]